MSLIKSILYGLKEAKYNPIIIIHSILYAVTVTCLRVLKKLVKLNPKSFRNHICESKCKKENIFLILDAEKGIFLNIETLTR
ncbi:MAG: hypothetical protein JRD93_17320 [Deltaproteobacteria bacterium]|nr:hypothetical protein [Deltaproteobacteria bacterium]